MATRMAQGAEIVVFSTISCKEALIELVPEYEHASGHKIDITYAGGGGLAQRIRDGTSRDLFVGPQEFSGPLIAEGTLVGASRAPFAHSRTALAVRAGAPKPDISSPEKLKGALLAARSVMLTASRGLAQLALWQIKEQIELGE